MCLLGIAFGLSPEFPVMLLANREELYARPSAAPQIVSRTGEAPAWIGGVDLLAGGTWLGVAESGLVVAVTNRAKTALPLNPRSRGILCRSLLEYRDAGSAGEAAQRELESNQYAGCNLLIADRERAFVIEAGNFLKTTTLSAGLHLIANHNLNPADDPRIGRVRRAFDHVNPADDAACSRARHGLINGARDREGLPPVAVPARTVAARRDTIRRLFTPLPAALERFSSSGNQTAVQRRTDGI